MQIQRSYACFYLDGREAKVLKADIDEEQLAERVLNGEGSVHEVTHKAVSDAARGLLYDREKRTWIAKHEEEIKEAGGNSEIAYEHYCAGRIDELTSRLEEAVLEAMEEDDEEDEDEDEDDDEDEDGDDE